MGYESMGHRVLKFSVDETHHGPPRKAGLVSCLLLVSLDITITLGIQPPEEHTLSNLHVKQGLAVVSGVLGQIKFESPWPETPSWKLDGIEEGYGTYKQLKCKAQRNSSLRPSNHFSCATI